MSVKVMDVLEPEKQFMRDAYCETMKGFAENDKNIIVMDADLMGAMGMKPFEEAYPEQTIDCGIQEANMIGVACGLSAVGKVPYVHTFGPFASRRVADQVFMSGVYAGSNIRIMGSDPGITAQINGGTHMPFDDMGIMKGFPEMTVLEPTDCTMLKWILKETKDRYGMFYIRLVRKECTKVYSDDSDFEFGKAVTLKEGKDVTIIASGYCVAESLKAAKLLESEGIHAKVLNVYCWKPLDEEAIIRAARETGAVVTAENHTVVHGLGASVSSTLSKHAPVPMEMIGVQDEFGEVGNMAYLSDRFHLNAEYIVEAAKKAVSRKEV